MSKYLANIAPARAPAVSRWSDLPLLQRNFIVLTLATGLIAAASSAILVAGDQSITVHHMLFVGLLFAAILFTPGVHIRRGAEHAHYKFWEYPIIVGLAISPAYLVALALTIAAALSAARAMWTQPGKRARAAVAFGALAVAAPFGCAVATIYEPYTYPVGCLLIAVVSDLFLFGYDITRGGLTYAREAWRGSWGKRLGVAALISMVSAALVFVLGPQREFLLFSPLAVLILYWLVEAQIDAIGQKTSWSQMESISTKFIGELNEHNTVQFALMESLRLFSARRTEIVLYRDGNDPAQVWALKAGPGQKVSVEVPADGEVPDLPSTVPAHQRALRLGVGDRNLGFMMLDWDPQAPERIRRHSLMTTFGHAVAASIANTRHNRQVEQQAAEKAREAEHDPLTGLGNRSRLASEGPVVISDSRDIDRRAALLLFDLDGFKRINDTLGHAAGDKVLVEVARRVEGTVRKSDLAIRLGGDEFAILAGDLELPPDAERLASKINQALIPPIEVEGLELSIEASIGIALCPDDAADVDSLLKLADIAMYRAKALGRGTLTRYNQDIDFETADSLQLATDLRRAIVSRDELVLHYQPQIDLRTGEVVGMEALIRWQHPTHGMLSPDRFVHIAEHSNLIRPFTLAILKKALAARVQMRELLPDATVSVNLSAQNLLDTGLPRDVERLLDAYGICPDEVVLEVTETATATDLAAAQRVMRGLAALGCKIAMDDFGTGYATLDSLRSGSPVSEIKMDRGFVKDIATNSRDCQVAKAIIEIAHAWDCRMVAEGIEDVETYELLKELNCDYAQGYFLHRPAPLDAVLAWVKDRPQNHP